MFKRVIPPLTPVRLTLLVALWFVVFCNGRLWQALWNILGGVTPSGALFALSLPILAFALINAGLTLLSFGRATRPVLSVLLVVTSFAVYFMAQYNVKLDRGMIQNIFETDVREATELFSFKLALYVLLLGVLPVAILARVPVVKQGFLRELGGRAVSLSVSLAVAFGMIFLLSQEYAALARNHKELRDMFTPINYLRASYAYAKQQPTGPVVVAPVGTDAHKGALWTGSTRRAVTIVVVGETARAANFSLGGYERKTNPELEKQDIVYFDNAHSCGTATAVSVPCMFSDMGRVHYDEAKALAQEGLLDVLKHAGLEVLWRDNNSGCKGTCDRVKYEDLSRANLPGLCEGDECFDEVLAHNLQQYIDGLQRDAVIVLHQKGSHGPAYYRRYPKEFGKFQPVCKTNELGQCSREEISNAYDNSLLYTDHVLSQLIDLLRSNQDHVDTALFYISDHGESLGENNLYLHGAPYMIAPEQQTHVPALTWLSSGFQSRFKIDAGCLRAHRGDEISQDNLFHSMLGLMNIETSVYQPDLDFFRRCRSQ